MVLHKIGRYGDIVCGLNNERNFAQWVIGSEIPSLVNKTPIDKYGLTNY